MKHKLLVDEDSSQSHDSSESNIDGNEDLNENDDAVLDVNGEQKLD